MPAEWLPAATLAAGVVGTLGGQGLREWLTSGREREARAAEREVARNAFQRDTLLELQDALLELVQSASRIHLHQGNVYGQTERFGRDNLPEDLNEASGLTNARTSRLQQRILDEQVRQELASLKNLCTEITFPNTGIDDAVAWGNAHNAWLRLPHVNKQLEDRIGTVLRGLL
jgi:hypothetical protein